MVYKIMFLNAGVPQSGLSPTITVYKKVSDGSDVASPPAISAIGGGGYKFTATPAEEIYLEIDGGASLSNLDRYKTGVIGPNDAYLDAAVSTRAPEAGGNLAAVKAKTDNLPVSPAAVGSAMALTAAYDAAKNAAPELGGNIAAIKAKTDNLPVNPANEANVETHVTAALNAYDPPTRAEATADKDAILAALASAGITVEDILSGNICRRPEFSGAFPGGPDP